MKTYFSLTTFFFSVMLFCSCGSKTPQQLSDTDSVATTADSIPQEAPKLIFSHASWSDSCEYQIVHMDADFPIIEGEAGKNVNKEFIKTIDEQIATIGCEDGERLAKEYSGDNINNALKYYGKALSDYLNKESKNMYEEQKEYCEEGATPEITLLDSELKVTKLYENDKCIVMNFLRYVYLGGTHGYANNSHKVFNKKTGNVIKNAFVKNATTKMQKLLCEGAKQYFSENGEKIKSDKELFENLMIENNTIPLPVVTPAPTKEGLLFVYQQYEIACYAAGMVCFVIPYDKVLPYLSDEMKEVIE